MTAQARQVGRVAALWRYPVKSMAAEALEAVDISWDGLAGDRRWGFVREGMERNGFPWLTIRERPDMWSYRPSYLEPDRPERSATIVRTPSGRDLDVADVALAEELGHGARVMKQNHGVFDAMPLSLITTRAIADIGAIVGRVLDVRRFRPNVLIEPEGEGAFPEDTWVGSVLRVGGFRMRVDRRDKRCVMVNVDPTTIARDPSVLRAIAATRQACLGVYGSIIEPGRVAVGDGVFLAA